jgi:hypothetical protein
VDFLNSREWDVVALQEVSRHAWEVITERGIAESSVYALDFFETAPLSKRHHGAALLARSGFQLSTPKLVLGLPKAERALVARTTVGDMPVTVASWHAPNAAGEGVATKMQGYRGIVEWLAMVNGPIVLGFDGNHWNLSAALEPSSVPESNDPWLLENQFFGDSPPHRLRDAFLDYLRAHQPEYEVIKRRRPQGPLGVSYVRGSRENAIEDASIMSLSPTKLA